MKQVTANEIRANIRYNENLIAQYQAERRQLSTQIEELERLRNKLSELQSSFYERQRQRSSKLSCERDAAKNEVSREYFSRMSNLMGAGAFRRACEEIDESRSRTNRRIYELDNQRDACEERLAYRKNRRDYWYQRLNAVLAGG